MAWLALVLVLLLPWLSAGRPVIGIFPTIAAWIPPQYAKHYYDIYKEWVEQFGASTFVLPMQGDAAWYVQRMNGLLIPGGASLPVASFARDLIWRAIEVNEAGDYFPVFGTCLGFQWIVEAVAGKPAIEMNKFNAENLSTTIFVGSPGGSEANRSKLYSTLNSTAQRWLETENITFFNHKDGIEPAQFDRNPRLSDLFRRVATSSDRRGRSCVAALEGKSLPIYGVQYHPEKIRYMHGPAIPRSPRADVGADMLAEFFVSEARRSHHRSTGLDEAFEARAALCRQQPVCCCQELAAVGYVALEACRRHHPRPAVEYCMSYGSCPARASVDRPIFL